MGISSLGIWIAVCILLIIFFVGTEISFVSANKLNLQLRKKQGKRIGKILGHFMERPYEFIGTNVVGFTIALALYSLFISRLLEPIIVKAVGLVGSKNETLILVLSLFLDILLATIIILVVAELLPKAIFRKKPNAVLHALAYPAQLFYKLLYPIARLLIAISEFMLKYLFNVRIREDKDPFQRLDLEYFVKYSLQGSEGQDDELNQGLFENALHLVKLRVRNCMVPRNEIVAIPISSSITEAEEKFSTTRLSRIPVYEDNLDNIVGYLHHIDLYKQPASIQEILHVLPTAPESMGLLALMEQMRKEKKNMAWVLDEYGGTAGIISMKDILEEIFGEIKDEYNSKELLEQQLSENTFLFSGRHELEYLNDRYQLEIEEIDKAETLSGYIVHHIGRIPLAGERFFIRHLEFDILLVTDTRIETVKVKMLS